tara:strand:+ start:5431 stop:5586 length:156 start_codon:yes stop_codon:yes gene_type:complete
LGESFINYWEGSLDFDPVFDCTTFFGFSEGVGVDFFSFGFSDISLGIFAAR